jgi:hypothetical protein
MSFEHDTRSTSVNSQDRGRPLRPNFSSTKTSDRLRESERRPSLQSSTSKPRRSVFREEGLEDLNRTVHPSHNAPNLRKDSIPAIDHEDRSGRNVTFDQILKEVDQQARREAREKAERSPWYSKMGKSSRPKIKTVSSAPPGAFSSIPRVALIVFLISVIIPGFRYSSGRDRANISGADAGVIMRAELVENGSTIEGRENSPTAICTRWSHMSMFAILLHLEKVLIGK